jgi:ABC-type sugar transport system permease subunit
MLKFSRKRGLSLQKRAVPYAFMAPTVLLFLVIFAFPIGFVIWTSMFDWNMLKPQDGKTFL